MDLDDSGGAVTVVEAGERGEEGVVDESSNEWYAGVKEEDNGEDTVGSTAAGMGGVKRELMSGDDENSQDVVSCRHLFSLMARGLQFIPLITVIPEPPFISPRCLDRGH